VPRIDPNDPRPPYQQIASELRRTIHAGEIEPGNKLPSSRELATEYGVAAMTVHQAIRVLRDEGLVNSHQGRGVFVRTDRDDAEQPDLPAQISDVQHRLSELTASLPANVGSEISDLRRQVGLLQAQLIDLYAKTGHAYPHEDAPTSHSSETSSRRRKASGS
jgi:DNA-binding transcriptional regulator YhcF (GntR family)